MIVIVEMYFGLYAWFQNKFVDFVDVDMNIEPHAYIFTWSFDWLNF